MLKYYTAKVVFAEVPGEVSLAISLTNCPHKCEECHSPWLREDIGDELTNERLTELVKSNDGITCLLYLGGEANPRDLISSINYLIKSHPGLKVAAYSGNDYPSGSLMGLLDYYKWGSYQKDKGPLTSKTTNQIMVNKKGEDITHLFQKENQL